MEWSSARVIDESTRAAGGGLKREKKSGMMVMPMLVTPVVGEECI
eukprot:COSAG02_NODE_2186_length_9573_cov_5.783091_8_plen_45_part_00